MFIVRLSTFTAALACIVFVSGSTIAQDTQGQQRDQTDQSQTDRQDNMQEQWLNQLSQKFDLTEDQKTQIRTKVELHNQKLQSTWQKFSQAHMQTVSLEASMYAALEQHMTSQQKEQFRQNRDKSSGDSSSSSASNRDASQKQLRETDFRQDKTDTSGESRDTGTDRTDASQAQDQGSEKGQGDPSVNSLDEVRDDPSSDEASYYVTTMIVVPVRKSYMACSLDTDSLNRCHTTCGEYQSKLTSSWQSVHQYHNQLVKLEAEKILAIEEVLNEEQLEMLRQERSGSENSSGSESRSDG